MRQRIISEDKLSLHHLDLRSAQKGQINESFLAMFGWGIKRLLKAVIGDVAMPVNLKGSPSDVEAFLGTLGAEKTYIQDFKSMGLNNPRTYKSKGELKTAIGKFERKTGIKWPFK